MEEGWGALEGGRGLAAGGAEMVPGLVAGQGLVGPEDPEVESGAGGEGGAQGGGGGEQEGMEAEEAGAEGEAAKGVA